MQVAAHPYLAAGVALIGASAIAISPVAPPMPDITVPAVSSAEVSLSAATDPIQAYVQLVTNTFTNVSTLIGQELADPAPILRQVIDNQIATAVSLGTALQDSAVALGNALDPSNPYSIPSLLQLAVSNLLSGDINGAVANAWSAFLTPVVGVGLPLLEPITAAIRQPIQNVLNVVDTQLAVVMPLLGALNVAYRTITVAGNVGQEILDSATAGDALAVVSTMLSSPAVIADAFLNGDELGGGVFGPSLGLLGTLRQAREMIAAAITPPAAEAAGAATDTTLRSAPKLVTLDVAPATEKAAPAVSEAAVTAETAPAPAASTDEDTPSKATTPVAKDSLKAAPGKTLSTKRSASAKQVRENIQGSVKNVTDGLKKAAEGLSGNSAKAGKHRAAKSGAGSSSSGSGGSASNAS
ncbi:hypothetical protein [Mycolicibacterium fortuitum]|uniref:hypothetical protein n=1 Tax=Mycolicibacterium fortuitum TaxID=1766 RepID=UPI0007EF186F|nr:hypothetical protein [Mycolicibacterium fortuitum]MDG5771453.1 hypothetical protein [Mycolicibacterium fortuitum]MDG5782921.1 hypothetical protein [Mycolicibacterium fortuitum]OBK59278.1 hypothetical protein A5654_02525 [Mycolicibacterium fortuitum]UBV23143.1 hypothetical protein H8Z59_08385 [Mycolicibacterium fortuitum]UHJ54289.1 hypothetical protein LT337_22880 [Mycolicibacterium fortuitum]